MQRKGYGHEIFPEVCRTLVEEIGQLKGGSPAVQSVKEERRY